MQLKFNPSRLFSGTRDIDITVEPMEFPFLIGGAFDSRLGGAFVPDSLTSLLRQALQLTAKQLAPEVLRDRLERSMKAAGSSDGWSNGFFGTDNLPVEEITTSHTWSNITVGMTGARLQLRRYGDSIGIRAFDGNGKPHEEMNSIFAELAADDGPNNYVRSFVHAYCFGYRVELDSERNAWVLDMERELAIMDRYLPDVEWTGRRHRIAADIGGDFTGPRAGVKIGVYGDASVWVRVVYEREVDDQNWRMGMVRSTTGTRLSFSANTGLRPRLEYFIRTVDDNNPFTAAPMNIDYQAEQGLLYELARKFYVGLYQRSFQYAVDHGNQHFIRFMREV